MTMPEIDERSVTMAEVMTPDNVNLSGNIHGGHLLSLLDKVAYACAARYSGEAVVTLSFDNVLFKKPIHVGELVICQASVNYVGTSSMEIGIKVIAEDLRRREKRHTNTCYVTMVAVDKNLRPIKVKPLTLNNPIEKRRFLEAKLRREMRQQFAEEHTKRKQELKIND